jgi:hypothetical protein
MNPSGGREGWQLPQGGPPNDNVPRPPAAYQYVTILSYLDFDTGASRRRDCRHWFTALSSRPQMASLLEDRLLFIQTTILTPYAVLALLQASRSHLVSLNHSLAPQLQVVSVHSVDEYPSIIVESIIDTDIIGFVQQVPSILLPRHLRLRLFLLLRA